MRDDTGALTLAPVGSRLGMTPADTGGLATPLAPDHHAPAAPAAAAPRHDRLCAAPLAPGPDRPSDEPPCPPEQDRPCAASRAPVPHVPAAPAAAAPGAERLCAAPLVPGSDQPSAGPSRPPEQDRPRAVQAAASASAGPHVTPPVPPAPDCSRRAAAGPGPRPTSVTDTPASDLYAPAFTAQERQLLTHTDHDSPLAAEVRLLRVLILRLVTTPRRRRRRAGAAFQRRRRYARQRVLNAVCRAMDTLQRTLKTQHALASSDSTELTQFLDDIAANMEADQPPPTDPPAFTPLDPHTYPPTEPPTDPPTFTPLDPPTDLPSDHSPPTDPPIAPPAFTPRAPPTPTPPPEYGRPSKYPHVLLSPEPLDPPRPLLHTRSLRSLLDYDP